MAEYVRRKRPPADHPYWAHRRDRAHPPSIVWPVVLPAAAGVGVGLAAGLNDPVPARDAVETAAVTAGMLAGSLAACCLVPLLFNAIYHSGHADHWMNAALGVLFVGLFGFLFAFVPMALILLWYSVSGGNGPWVGMAVGAALGAGPGAILSGVSRHQWAKRRRR